MLFIFIYVILVMGGLGQSYSIRPLEKLNGENQSDKGCGGGNGENQSGKGCGGGTSVSMGFKDPKIKAANIAQKAAMEAKAANDAQNAAAEAAATEVKTHLADKALQSARTAEAVLAGKQQVMEQLEIEHREAEAVVQDVSNSLQSTQANAAAASNAANEARTQLSKLKQLVAASVVNLANLESVSGGAQQELAEKSQLLEAAQNRIKSLRQQLSQAKEDYDKTKKAAYKAACSAVEAKQKAQRTRRNAPDPSTP